MTGMRLANWRLCVVGNDKNPTISGSYTLHVITGLGCLQLLHKNVVRFYGWRGVLMARAFGVPTKIDEQSEYPYDYEYLEDVKVPIPLSLDVFLVP
jgi:hypothetical protein